MTRHTLALLYPDRFVWTEDGQPVPVISGGDGGDAPEIPEPTPEERALQQEQVELLRQQRDILSRTLREQQLLAPIMFQRAGLRVMRDPMSGEIVGVEELPLSDAQRLAQSVERELLERTQRALRGELPVPSAIEKALAEQERTLREMLFRSLGPGYETSTPGIEALQRFRESAEAQREAFRRGELDVASALGLQLMERSQRDIDRFLSRVSGVNALPFGGARTLGELAMNFGGAMQPFIAQRGLEFARNAQAAQMAAAEQARIASTVGGAVSGAATGAILAPATLGLSIPIGALLGAGLGYFGSSGAGGGSSLALAAWLARRQQTPTTTTTPGTKAWSWESWGYP